MLLLGAAAVYLASVLLGFTNAATVQPVIDVERTVFYRCVFPVLVSLRTVSLPDLELTRPARNKP